MPRRLALAVAALAAVGAVVAGVVALTASDATERAAPSLAAVRLDGAPLQSANCERWWAASEAQRGRAIDALSRSVGGATGSGRGTTLPDARVHGLFDRVCAPTFTRHFLLYEIYIRAAGFKSLGN